VVTELEPPPPQLARTKGRIDNKATLKAFMGLSFDLVALKAPSLGCREPGFSAVTLVTTKCDENNGGQLMAVTESVLGLRHTNKSLTFKPRAATTLSNFASCMTMDKGASIDSFSD